jgi:MarR family transcriptional regulator for hemolysin
MKKMMRQGSASISQDFRQTIGIELGITIRLWRARMDECLAPLGLTQAKWVPLRYLAHAGGCLPQKKLVEQVGIEGPSLVRILDELEHLGLIERQMNDADRRARTIKLTAQAKPLVKQIEHRAETLRNKILEGISEKDLNVFHKVLTQISDNLLGLTV